MESTIGSIAQEVALLPCPFCGGPAQTRMSQIGPGEIWVNVYCPSQPQIMVAAATHEKALTTWNTRVGATPPPRDNDTHEQMKQAIASALIDNQRCGEVLTYSMLALEAAYVTAGGDVAALSSGADGAAT